MIDNSLSLFPRTKFIENGTSLLKDGPGMPSAKPGLGRQQVVRWCRGKTFRRRS